MKKHYIKVEYTEYTPYGETWIQESKDTLNYIHFKFTSKELDDETGLYYFGARYLDPQMSRWMTCDPAFSSYLPRAGQDGSKLPGQSGVFNPINLNQYCYSGNNPITYKDPNGSIIVLVIGGYLLYKALSNGKSHRPDTSNLNHPSRIGSEPVRYFQQREFNDRYKDKDTILHVGFGHDDIVQDKSNPKNWIINSLNTACHVTAGLNEISEEYTKITGKSMSKEIAEKMLDKALENGSIDVWGNFKKDSAAAEFFNDAWSVTGLDGTWEKNDKGDHILYNTHRYDPSKDHYESNGPTGGYLNPHSGKEENLPNTPKTKDTFHYERK